MTDVTYVLSTFPLARETFVAGEIAAVADLVDRTRVVALNTTGEADLRPGGIPDRVPIDWFSSVAGPRAALDAVRGLGHAPGLVAGGARDQVRGHALRDRLGDLRRAARVVAWTERHRAALADTHLHAHFATRGAMAASLVGRLTGRPYSVTVHAYDVYMDNPYLASAVAGAAFVVAISEHGRAALLERVAVATERVQVIHAGVPTDRLLPRPADHDRAAAPGRPARIVSAGRLIPKKGFVSLVEAIDILRQRGREASLEIIGDGPLRGAIEADIARRDLGGIVTLSGSLPPDEVHRRTSAADLFALACARGPDGDLDGIPVVLMEAMALGVPVVSTRMAGVPELIDHERNGRLARADDPLSLADEIEATLDAQPADRAAAVGAARQTVVTAFDQARNAARLVEAIQRVARR